MLLLSANSCTSGLFGSKAPLKLEEAWKTDDVLRTPESALHDPQRDVIYVSNINKMSEENRKDGDGFISTLTTDGKVDELYWVTGLNDPKGIALYNNVLYIADIDELVAVSTQTGAILGRYKADKAEMLNDVTVDNSGNVYVTDSGAKRVYQFSNGRLTRWMDNTAREKPNGIYFDGDRLLLALMSSGEVRFLDPETKKLTDWTEGIKNADGIAKMSDGNYLVSGWDGEVYLVLPEGKNYKLLDTKGKNINAADISYSERLNVLLVPTFKDNRVFAYTLSE